MCIVQLARPRNRSATIDSKGESFIESLWPARQQRNPALALAGRSRLLCRALDIPPSRPDVLIGFLDLLPLPPCSPRDRGIEVPVAPSPGSPHRLIRVSARIDRQLEHHEAFASALQVPLGEKGA